MTQLRVVTLLIPVLLPVHQLGAQNFETTTIAEGVYRFRHQSHNGLFVVTPEGVVAFDPISVEAAGRFATEIERVAPGAPLLAVVYSHHHADHATGANVLRQRLGRGAPIIAHQLAVDRIRSADDPDLPVPDLTFSDRMALHFGGKTIELHFLGRSHSDNMIVALLPAERIAFAVDFVANDRVGYRDLPSHYFPDFFDTLHGLATLEFDTVVFGHGPPGDRASVERQIRYYDDVRVAAGRALQDGWSEDRAAQEVRLPDYEQWDRYDDWLSMNVRAMYRWLAANDR